MTDDELQVLTRAWALRDVGPASRDRVVDLEEAIRPLAAHLGTSNSRAIDRIAALCCAGMSVGEAVRTAARTPLVAITAAMALLLSACGACSDGDPLDRPLVVHAGAATSTTTTAPAASSTTWPDPNDQYDLARLQATTTAKASRSRPRTTTTTSARRPAPAPVVPHGDIEQAICAAFGDQCAKAIAVAKCESGLRPGATNGNHRGLFQVSIYWHHYRPIEIGKESRLAKLGYTPDDMWSVAPNIAVARDIQKEQGWRPWTCA